MNTWLFQTKPDENNIEAMVQEILNDGYATDFQWIVAIEGAERRIKPGDRVYLWRAKGKGPDNRGIYGRGTVTSILMPPVKPDALAKHWRSPLFRGKPIADYPHVTLKLERVLKLGNLITRDSLMTVPALSDYYYIDHGQTGTNRMVDDAQIAVALDAAWNAHP